MASAPSISVSEWAVMQVLWDRSPLSAAEVVEALEGEKDWSPRTTKTLLNRLVGKGALKYQTQGNKYLYSPAVRREQCIRHASRSFLEQVFGGAALPALIHLVTNERLKPGEIDELRRLLDERRSS